MPRAFIPGTDIQVSFGATGLDGCTPLRLDVYGVYKPNYVEYQGMPETATFVVSAVERVSAFHTYSDMIYYLSNLARAEELTYSYEIAEEVVVSLIDKRGSMYVQYYNSDYDEYNGIKVQQGRMGRAIQIGSTVAVGDKLTMTGVYTPMVTEGDIVALGGDEISCGGWYDIEIDYIKECLDKVYLALA